MWRVNNVKDLAGQKFGRLLAVKQNGRDKSGRILWLCACECGAEKTVRGTHLSSGATTSCGCLRRAIASAVATKHGHAKGGKTSSTYNSWVRMLDRCSNPKNIRYDRYGGRGITVCDRWRYSFENFLADMGEKPSTKFSIDSIDNNGDYEPENCRWATASQQAINRSTTVHKAKEF